VKRLKRNLDKLFERGKSFLKRIKSDEKLLLMYHTDIDGVCSGAIVFTGLKRMGIKVSKALPSSEIVKKIDEMEKFDTIITTDIPFDKKKFILAKKRFLIIDHHPEPDFNRKDVVMVNPRFEKKDIYQSASYVAYKFFSKVVNLEDMEWMAVVGSIGDYSLKDCKDLLKKYMRIKKEGDVWKTKFGRAAIRINSMNIQLGQKESMRILLSFKDVDNLLKNERIERIHKKFLKVYEECEKKFWKNSEVYEDLIFSVIKTKHRGIGSWLASRTSMKNPEKIILVLDKGNGIYHVHARYQVGKIDVGYLMKKFCDIEGGGHEQAGGGSIRDLEGFKRKILDFLQKENKI